jgi:hydroxymethylpyrimidine/phosphomethylpyrimidine kinase
VTGRPAAAPVPIALTIAGSDSGGGAGVQADLKTFSALGVYGASVLTALTAQNTRAVTAVHDVPPAFVRAQLQAVFSDLPVAAVKIGMLSQAAVIVAVAEVLARPGLAGLPVVLDPVMLSKSGAALLQPDAVQALRRELLPRALVITPNLPEAAVLLGTTEAAVQADPEAACAALRRLGAGAVVLKGGHGGGARSDDLLDAGGALTWLRGERLATRNTHGTGCTFSAALAAGLAHGLTLDAAALAAKRYLHEALVHADELQVGAGCGPVHHFHALWPTPAQQQQQQQQQRQWIERLAAPDPADRDEPRS